jgi:hypothetical protein
MSDHLEHLAECQVCAAADEADNIMNLVEFETDMLVEEVGKDDDTVIIYNPLLMKLWDSELQRNELISAATDETAKYYTPDPEQFDIDIDLPPRPDTEE